MLYLQESIDFERVYRYSSGGKLGFGTKGHDEFGKEVVSAFNIWLKKNFKRMKWNRWRKKWRFITRVDQRVAGDGFIELLLRQKIERYKIGDVPALLKSL